MNKKQNIVEHLSLYIKKLENDILFEEETYSAICEDKSIEDNTKESLCSQSLVTFVQKLSELKKAKEALKTYYQLQEESDS